jgi:hypothetical protein
MSNLINVRTIAAASAFAAISAMAVVAQTGTASAKNVLSCDGTSRRSVIECCETLVQKKGLPYWMVREGRNCQTATVVCRYGTFSTAVAGGGQKYCKMVLVDIEREDKTKHGGGSRGRGTFNRN